MDTNLLNISYSLSSILGVPELDMQNALRIALSDYTVQKKVAGLVLLEESIETKAYKMFLIAKHTEGLSDKSLAYYRGRLQFIFKAINKPFLQISTDDIRMYFAQRGMINKLAKTTLNNERRVLSSFYSWLAEEEYMEKNPMLRIKNIKEEKRIKKPLSEEEMELLRRGITDLRGMAIIEFLYSTGVRVGEMVTLNISDINFQEGCCIVFGKGQKERYVYLNTKCKMALRDYISSRRDNQRALFIGIKGKTKRLTIGAISGYLKRLAKETKVENVHPHRFRRTAATTALNRGMPIEQVQKMLGHSNIETTTIYAASNQDNIQQSHKKYLS